MNFRRITPALIMGMLASAPAAAGTHVASPGGKIDCGKLPSPQLTSFGDPWGKFTGRDYDLPRVAWSGALGGKLGVKGRPTPKLIIVGHPGPKISAGFNETQVVVGGGWLSGRGHTVSWVSQDGATLTQRFVEGQDPFSEDGLIVPDGTWTDVVLAFEGPVTLVGASEDGRCWAAEVDGGEWALPLAEPVTGDGETRVYADIELPSWVMEAALDAGGWLDLDHPLHDEVWTAVQDGTLFTP